MLVLVATMTVSVQTTTSRMDALLVLLLELLLVWGLCLGSCLDYHHHLVELPPATILAAIIANEGNKGL